MEKSLPGFENLITDFNSYPNFESRSLINKFVPYSLFLGVVDHLPGDHLLCEARLYLKYCVDEAGSRPIFRTTKLRWEAFLW